MLPECPYKAFFAEAMATKCLHWVPHSGKADRASLPRGRLINKHKIVPSEREFIEVLLILYWCLF